MIRPGRNLYRAESEIHREAPLSPVAVLRLRGPVKCFCQDLRRGEGELSVGEKKEQEA
jgi:hypothetical protein